jgi:hypothetical protein
MSTKKITKVTILKIIYRFCIIQGARQPQAVDNRPEPFAIMPGGP